MKLTLFEILSFLSNFCLIKKSTFETNVIKNKEKSYFKKLRLQNIQEPLFSYSITFHNYHHQKNLH